MLFRAFLYEATACASYLCGCLSASKLAVVDPHVELLEEYASHYGGSVCGRTLSANPFSSVGVERAHNHALAHDDAEAFVRALLVDVPSADHAAIVAANRAGRVVVEA
ncbi:MAG: hypothetical protein M3229_01090 [Actinomycetota bacterium]|nr:hypothetical protein [Actinomycetota bacterium]